MDSLSASAASAASRWLAGFGRFGEVGWLAGFGRFGEVGWRAGCGRFGEVGWPAGFGRFGEVALACRLRPLRRGGAGLGCTVSFV
jgi:hypothetical protein